MSTVFSVSLVSRRPTPSDLPVLKEVDRLVASSVSYTDELNRPGSAVVSCNVRTLSDVVKGRLRDLAGNPCEVWIYADAELAWAGEVQTLQVQGPTVSLNCVGLAGYLARMGITADATFSNADQLTIAKTLVDSWQSQSYGNYGISTAGVGESGRLRDRTYLRGDLKNVQAALTELAESLDGFDFMVDPRTRRLRLFSPRRGHDLSGAVIIDSRSITDYSVMHSIGGDDLASDVGAASSAQDQGGTQTHLYSYAQDLPLQHAYGRSWAGQSFDNVSVQSTLDDKAQSFQAARGKMLLQPGVTVRQNIGTGVRVGSFGPGDSVAYSFDAGLGVQAGIYRVSKVTVKVDEGGQHELSLDFDLRRLDDLVRTVVAVRTQLTQLQSTALNRLATHTHAPDGGTATPPGTGGGTGTTGTQTLGVGGIATPPAGAGVVLVTADSTETLHITTDNVTYDGLGHTVGQILIEADGVTVQNFYSRGAGNAGIYSIGAGNTIQNCDIAQVDEGGEGDINGITFFGDDTRILFNAIGRDDYLAVRPLLGSHTDGIQCWNTPTKVASSNVTIRGNWIEGPTTTDDRYVHQSVMAEGEASLDGGGGGTGVSTNWLVEGNYFRSYGNQCLKFDDIHDVTIARNTFAGAGAKCVATGSLSTGISFVSSGPSANVVTGSYSTLVGD